jgi:hypothetical protein
VLIRISRVVLSRLGLGALAASSGKGGGRVL